MIVKEFICISFCAMLLILSTGFVDNNDSKSPPNILSNKEYLNKADSSKSSTSKLTICIDPGHQLKGNSGLEPIAPGSKIRKAKVSSGTRGVVTKLPEYKLNLAVALKLEALLKKENFHVVMTRETNDVDLSNIQRAEIANNSKADLFIRIHADGAESKLTNGISVLYPSIGNCKSRNQYEMNKTIAGNILEEAVSSTSAKSNNIVERKDMTGFNWAEVPTVLIEMGFMTNPNEDKKLSTKEYQEKLAEGIAQGISKSFLNNK